MPHVATEAGAREAPGKLTFGQKEEIEQKEEIVRAAYRVQGGFDGGRGGLVEVTRFLCPKQGQNCGLQVRVER